MRIAIIVLAMVLACPFAAAKVERARVLDAEGTPLAVATWDDDKAMSVGAERGFLVLVQSLNRSLNLMVVLEVARWNESALRVLSPSVLAPLGNGPVDLAFRLRANGSDSTGRYEVVLALAVVNLNATTNETSVTRVELPVNVTLSRIPAPLGETPATLSQGERTVLVSAIGALALVAAVGVRSRGRSR